jgi:hypothetical protein
MVNHNLRKILKIHLQEEHPCSSQKEASIMIMISQGRNSKGLCNIPDIKSMQNKNKMLEMAE